MTDEQQLQKRRVLIAVIAVVALIGVGGVTIALVVGDDGTSGSGETFDLLTVEGQCRTGDVMKFVVAPDPATAPEPTATDAVARWLLPGEYSKTPNAGVTSKLIAIGKSGGLPREVLTVSKGDGGWVVVGTAACLDAADGERACTPETLTIGKVSYSRKSDATESAEPGRHLGDATLTSCPTVVGGRQLDARGVIGPVSAYAAKGNKDAVVVTDGSSTRLFSR